MPKRKHNSAKFVNVSFSSSNESTIFMAHFVTRGLRTRARSSGMLNGPATSNTLHEMHRTFLCTFRPVAHRFPLQCCPHMRVFRRVLSSEDCCSVVYTSVALCFRRLCVHDLENCQIWASLSPETRLVRESICECAVPTATLPRWRDVRVSLYADLRYFEDYPTDGASAAGCSPVVGGHRWLQRSRSHSEAKGWTILISAR